jgi:hypothetical protein
VGEPITQSAGKEFVKAGSIVGGASVSAEITTSTGIWANWASIAVRQEDFAHQARAELGRIYAVGGDWGKAAGAELEASLIAISGAAFAIDGFYGSVKPWSGVTPQLIDLWKDGDTPRHRQIIEVFKLGFNLGPATNLWPKQFKWLFKLRSDNIHYDEDFRLPTPHPVIGNSTHERMTYAVENAEKAVNLMLAVLTRLVEHPKDTADSLLIDFARRWQPNVRSTVDMRDKLKKLRASN